MRSTARLSAIALGLALALAAPAWAQNQNQNPKKEHDSSTSEMETIRGVVAGVTVLGETVVNTESGRAEESDVTVLTIVGSPHWGHRDEQHAAKGADRLESGRRMRHRDNVYILAISPTTKIREANGWKKEEIDSASTATLDQLELGDYVQATYKPIAHERPGKQVARKHGRHRMFRGRLESLTVLPHPAHHHEAATSGEKPDHRGEKPDQPAEKSNAK
jgi:hypothetical protein